MKPFDEKHYNLLKSLRKMPGKMLSLYGRDNVVEFLLHDLSNEECFNLHKAAYLVDNPDFNHFKGVAGFNEQEIFLEQSDIWQAPDPFTEHMYKAPFHQKVRGIERESSKKACVCDADLVSMLAKELGIQNAEFICWELKNHNHGVLLFEKTSDQPWEREDLECVCYLLGMCPIY